MAGQDSDRTQSGVNVNYENKVKFQPYSCIIDPGFWKKLSQIKLNLLKLSEESVPIHATYTDCLKPGLPCIASLSHDSFDSTAITRASECLIHGRLICLNSIEKFHELDKKNLLHEHGQEVWKSIQNSEAVANPQKSLSKFILIVYADLKKYIFYYWFAFPSLNSTINVRYAKFPSSEKLQIPIKDILDPSQLYTQISELSLENRAYFIIVAFNSEEKCTKTFPLSQYDIAKNLYNEKPETRGLYFAYLDPSSDSEHPGWPIRNFLCLISDQFHTNPIDIIRIRRNETTKSLEQSIVIRLAYETSSETEDRCPLVTGWERNEKGQLAPRKVCLANQLDPTRIAEDAVNLNLKLMRWRLVPDLDLESIAATRCLLLGAGTLGCHVARGLVGWGVKTITFVDNSKVSYSNPVRQTLYNFEDCLNGGKNKALAASDALKRIYPLVDSKGICLSIPMPGHHISDRVLHDTRRDVEQLEKLIEDHDTIFLLMDTRESRWLPTLIAASKRKLVINAAIGFDTFLLQRHGIRDVDEESPSDGPDPTEKQDQQLIESNMLGCYFCNDIVVPGDSTIDRTLDQQCTVSRPGVSMMVSALAVELMISVLSHPLKSQAPACTSPNGNSEENESLLGLLPHSIRGSLSLFEMYMPTTPSFSKCSACSNSVVRLYRSEGFDFLVRVFNDPNYLEEVAGLKDLQSVDDDSVWALSSSNDDDDDNQSVESG